MATCDLCTRVGGMMAIYRPTPEKLYCLQCISAAHVTEAVNNKTTPQEITVRSLRCVTEYQLATATAIGRVVPVQAVWFSPVGDDLVVKCPTCAAVFRKHAYAEIIAHSNKCGPAPWVSCNACRALIKPTSEDETVDKTKRTMDAVATHRNSSCASIKCAEVHGIQCAFTGTMSDIEAHMKATHSHEMEIDDLISRNRSMPFIRSLLVQYLQGIFAGKQHIPSTFIGDLASSGEVRDMFASLHAYAEEHSKDNAGMRRVLLCIRHMSRLTVKELVRLVSSAGQARKSP